MITKPDWSKAPSQATEFYPETSKRWAAYAAWRNGEHLLWTMVDGNMSSFPIPEKYPQLRPREEAIPRPAQPAQPAKLAQPAQPTKFLNWLPL